MCLRVNGCPTSAVNLTGNRETRDVNGFLWRESPYTWIPPPSTSEDDSLYERAFQYSTLVIRVWCVDAAVTGSAAGDVISVAAWWTTLEENGFYCCDMNRQKGSLWDGAADDLVLIWTMGIQ